MLTDNAKKLAYLLAMREGKDAIGVGPDTRQLVELWGDDDASLLRPALNELERWAAIRLDTGIGPAGPQVAPEYDLRGVVGIATRRAMEDVVDCEGLPDRADRSA